MTSITTNHQKLLPTLRHRLRSFICLYPELFIPVVNLKNSKERAVSKNTEIVIEGFPRSGNSFSVGAFESAQSHQVNIAHHLHAPAQIILAARYNIPAILLVRNPIDAVMSLKAMDLEFSNLRPPENQKLISLMKSYVNFYQRLIPYSDHYIVSLFDTTINNLGLTIEKVNKKFETNFQVFNHNSETAKNILTKRGTHAAPSKRRQEIKQLLHNDFETEAMYKISAKAQSIYQEFESIAQQQSK